VLGSETTDSCQYSFVLGRRDEVYLSALKIQNFRQFQGLSIQFNEGVTALVGENDAGKTAVIDAIRYVLQTGDSEYLRLQPEDFHIAEDGTQLESNDSIAHALLNIASALHNQLPSTAAVEAYEYLKWTPPILLDADPGESCGSMINTYHFQGESNSVNIRLASIHAEKGKTHAATLILETFNRTHFVERQIAWLEGKSSAAKLKQTTLKKNMMLMYVVMTRPSHMLCLAMRQNTLSDRPVGKTRRQVLTSSGWSILEL
jgi:hypothetical protein